MDFLSLFRWIWDSNTYNFRELHSSDFPSISPAEDYKLETIRDLPLPHAVLLVLPIEWRYFSCAIPHCNATINWRTLMIFFHPSTLRAEFHANDSLWRLADSQMRSCSYQRHCQEHSSLRIVAIEFILFRSSWVRFLLGDSKFWSFLCRCRSTGSSNYFPN
jgi:hypothetical protein